jgi:hypothetical protein
MAETLIDMVRSRIEAIRGGRMMGQELGILTRARERIEAIRAGKGLAGEGGIMERLGERFPAVKRVRGQLEPWERPALFERAQLKPFERPALFERSKTAGQISGVEVTELARKPALF